MRTMCWSGRQGTQGHRPPSAAKQQNLLGQIIQILQALFFSISRLNLKSTKQYACTYHSITFLLPNRELLLVKIVSYQPFNTEYVFSLWVGSIPWRRKWQPTPVFLPGTSHGQRNLVGYSPWGRRVRYHLVIKQPPPPIHPEQDHGLRFNRKAFL